MPVTKKRFNILSNRLRKLRGDKTQIEFAKVVGLSRVTVGYYENGDRIPDSLKLRKIAERCNVSADYLLGLTNDPRRNSSSIDELGITTDAIDIMKKVKKYDPSACLDAVTELLKWANDLKKEI